MNYQNKHNNSSVDFEDLLIHNFHSCFHYLDKTSEARSCKVKRASEFKLDRSGQYGRTISIPLPMVEFFIVHRLSNAMRMYYRMKWYHNQRRFHETEIDKVFAVSGVKDRRTFNSNLKRLMKFDFIFYNKKTGYYTIKSMLRFIDKSKVYRSVRIPVQCLDSINEFRNSIISSYVVHLMNKSFVKTRELRKGYVMPTSIITHKDVVSASVVNSPSSSLGVSLSLLAKCLSRSKSYVRKLIAKCQAASMLFKKTQVAEIPSGLYQFLAGCLDNLNLRMRGHIGNQIYSSWSASGTKLMVQLPNEYSSLHADITGRRCYRANLLAVKRNQKLLMKQGS